MDNEGDFKTEKITLCLIGKNLGHVILEKDDMEDSSKDSHSKENSYELRNMSLPVGAQHHLDENNLSFQFWKMV